MPQKPFYWYHLLQSRIYPLYYLSDSNLQQSLKQVKQIKQIKQTKQTKKSKENKKYISGSSVDILKGNSSVEHITSHSVKDTFGFTSWSTDDQEREMHFS